MSAASGLERLSSEIYRAVGGVGHERVPKISERDKFSILHWDWGAVLEGVARFGAKIRCGQVNCQKNRRFVVTRFRSGIIVIFVSEIILSRAWTLAVSPVEQNTSFDIASCPVKALWHVFSVTINNSKTVNILLSFLVVSLACTGINHCKPCDRQRREASIYVYRIRNDRAVSVGVPQPADTVLNVSGAEGQRAG